MVDARGRHAQRVLKKIDDDELVDLFRGMGNCGTLRLHEARCSLDEGDPDSCDCWPLTLELGAEA